MDFRMYADYICVAALLLTGISTIAALIRAITGKRTADRIIGVNMISTLVVMAISILAFYLDETWLLDVSLIYCMMSFLSIIILTKVYISEVKKKKEQEDNNDD